MRLTALWLLGMVAIMALPGETRSFDAGGAAVAHDPADEGLYYACPANEVAYNVQIVRMGGERYCVVYHSEPRKNGLYPGDAVKTGVEEGPFTYRMPADKGFRLYGDPKDSLSMMYSPVDTGLNGWGGAGNPMAVRGRPGDPYYYVFFLAVDDDDHDRQGSDFRHYICVARTRDFVRFELRTRLNGKPAWKPYSDDAPLEWRRPDPVSDTHGSPVRGRRPAAMPDTQGLIGSICYVGGRFHLFYTDVDTDDKTYLFHRTSSDIGSLDPGRGGWSDVERVSGPLMRGTVVRVAKARGADRWAVLYNGYKATGPDGALQPDLFLQYTRSLRVMGDGGLSELRLFDRMVGDCGVSDKYLGLVSGGGVFAQHYFLTDEHGNLTVPAQEDADERRGGMLTWADFSMGVYGGRVYRAGWDLPTAHR